MPNFKIFTGLNGELVAIEPSMVQGVTLTMNNTVVTSIDVFCASLTISLCPDNHTLQDVVNTLEGD